MWLWKLILTELSYAYAELCVYISWKILLGAYKKEL